MYRIKFTQNSSGKSLEIKLISHYTSVLGIRSGEGKTWFYNYIRDELVNGGVTIDAELPYIFSDTLSIERDLKAEERSIILIDELTLNRTSNLINKYNFSKHLIVSISRTLPFNVNSPIQGLYTIKASDGWFTCENLNDLKYADKNYLFDIVVTEACDNRSENELLKKWRPDITVIPANGNINVAAVTDCAAKKFPDRNILVLMDMFNIGQQYKTLISMQSRNRNVRFYDYGSFEQMLFNSEFLHGSTSRDPLEFPTLERYYESALQEYTYGTPYAYTHGHALSNCYLTECSDDCAGCSKLCADKFVKIVGNESCLVKAKADPVVEINCF